jgi:hypothetical protein
MAMEGGKWRAFQLKILKKRDVDKRIVSTKWNLADVGCKTVWTGYDET